MAARLPLVYGAAGAILLLCHHVTTNSMDDMHGGVPMGVINDFCDNGQDYLDVDWNPRSSAEYTCFNPPSPEAQQLGRNLHYYHCDSTGKRPIHMCMNQSIEYEEDLPTSGRHRPLWPVYGEYTYVPPQRWLHSLEHGALVFLYHPCANQGQINQFKSLAKGCLRRHVISAYKKLPPEMNFAVLGWRCKLVLSDVEVSLITKFVKSRAKKGLERVSSDGQYSAGLKHHAEIVTDFDDSIICPGLSVLQESMHQVQQSSLDRRRQYYESDSDMEEQVREIMDQFQSLGYPLNNRV